MSYNRTEKMMKDINRRHVKKFNNLKRCDAGPVQQLQRVNNIRAVSDSTSNVINLSSQQLNENAVAVLSRGLTYAPAPQKIPYENIIASVEDTIWRNRIPYQEADCLRQDVAIMLRKSKPPKRNISRQETAAMLDLRRNKRLLVLPADKGNATVVVDTEEYERKLTLMVNDVTTYKKVNYNPTQRVASKVTKLLQSFGNEDMLTRFRSHNPTSPKIYGLPKVHKPNWPLRPIVSQIDAPTYKLSRYLATILQEFIGKTETYIKDSRHFVHLLSEVQLQTTEIMVSFDVTSLFTSVPVDDTIEIIADLIHEADLPHDYVEWAKCCLKNGYFVWRGQHYLQVDGVAMGSPIAPVAANIFMEWLEMRALGGTSEKPRYWWRYVDDVFAIINLDCLASFTTHLNTIHPKIKFTVEKECDGVLPFLDVRVIRGPDGYLSHTVYRKPTHTDRYLRADSHHHPSHLASVPRTLINRALNLCDPQYLKTELDHIKQVLIKNGYNWRQCTRWVNNTTRRKMSKADRVPVYLPFLKGVTDKIGVYLRRKYNIRTFFRPPGQLRQLLRSPKDSEPLSMPGVYKIPCDCGKNYIGETCRSISTRLAEHIRSVKNMDTSRSAIAEHAQEVNHFLRFDKVSVLAKEKFLVPRKVREAIEIARFPNFNRDRGWNLAPAWRPVLQKTASFTNWVEDLPQDTISVVCTGLYNSTDMSDNDDNNSDHSSEVQPVPTLSSRAERAAARARRADAAAAASSARADVVEPARVAP